MKEFDTGCLSGYNHTIKDGRKFVTIYVKTPEEREDVYFQIGEYVAAQNCHSTRVLNQNISSIPYLLVNG